MKSKSNPSLPYLLLLIGVLAVSTAAILIRFALVEADSLVIAAYRLTISAILTVVLLGFTKNRGSFKPTKSSVYLLILSGTLLAVHFAAWIASLNYISVSSSVILVTTTPLWVALLSPFLLKEKVSPKFYWGMIIVMIGGIFIALSGSCQLTGGQLHCSETPLLSNSNSLIGMLLALLGALMAAGYMMIGRKLRAEMDNLHYTSIVYGVAALILDLVVVFRGDNLFHYSPRIFLVLIAMAVIPQMIGHSILNYSLQALPATVVSMALLGEPIGSTILAVIFLNEIPSTLEIIGGICILCGIIVSVLPGKKANAVSPFRPYPR
ncbi:MAG: DMT family transporter [Anaerolineaceae bacterium]